MNRTTHEGRKMIRETKRYPHREASKVEPDVCQAVRQRLQKCPYGFIYSKVDCEFAHGQLLLKGSVPSFYLKQLLQELLRDIEHIKAIRNEIDVVCATGLSSVKPNDPR